MFAAKAPTNYIQEPRLTQLSFWHDLAGSHYSNEIEVWMEENKHFVVKASNSPNVPQVRLINNLWGILVQKV